MYVERGNVEVVPCITNRALSSQADERANTDALGFVTRPKADRSRVFYLATVRGY
jgi:hypothetical protein